jgi:cytoskeleton-associated protein 5
MMWIGPSYLTLIDGLNKIQVKTLDDFAKENPAPTKSLKKGPKAAAGGDSGTGGGGKAVPEDDDTPDFSGMDAYDLATAVDIFKTYNEAFFEGILALPKWNEKKAKMEEFLQKAAKTPKFTNTNVGWISAIIKRLFMDPNVVVHKTALQILSASARGLRKNFSAVAKKEAGNLLPKFREGKLIDDIFQVLEAFDHCMKPVDIIDDIKACLKEKHTGVKCNTIEWMCKALVKKDQSETESVADKIMPIIIEMTDEGDKTVREAASKFVALVMFKCGDERFSKFTNKIQANKLKTIQKYQAEFEKGTTESQTEATNKGKPVNTASNSNKTKATDEIPSKGAVADKGKPPAKQKDIDMDKEDFAKTLPKGGKSLVIAQNESQRLKEPNMTIEEVEDKLRDVDFEQSVITGLNSNTWETKKDALLKTFSWLEDNAGFSEEIMILIRETTKSFSFSNPNFNKEIFCGLMRVSEDLECKKKLFNEENVRIMLEFCVERFNEKNFLNKIQDLLIRSCSMVDPKVMVSTLIDIVKKKTFNPKISETLNDLLSKLITILTATYMPVADLIEFAKFTFDQKNGSIRKIGTTIICQLYSNLGPKIKDYLQDVNQSIIKTLDAEMKKVTVNPKATPTVEIFGVKGGFKTEVGQAAPIADVSGTLNALIPALEHSNWQTRKEGLEQCLTILASASYNIKPNGLENFMVVIGKRVEDSHKTPLKVAIEFMGMLAKSLGKNMKPWIKIIVPSLMKNLQDKQEAVRESTVEALSLIYDNVESEKETLIKGMFNALSQESVELKQEVLNFLNDHTDCLEKVDYKNTIEVILKGLESKAKNLRDSFELFLKNSVELKGEDAFLRAAKNLNPASSKAVIAILDKIAGRDSGIELGASTRLVRDPSSSKLHKESKPIRRDVSRSREPSVTRIPTKSEKVDTNPEELDKKIEASNLLRPGGQEDSNQIPGTIVYSDNGMDPNRVEFFYQQIYTSGGRKARMISSVWSFDGPNDKNLQEFYSQIHRHFNSTLIKGMFSLELDIFQPVRFSY